MSEHQPISEQEHRTRIIVSAQEARYAPEILSSIGLTPRMAEQVFTDGKPINADSGNVVVGWREINRKINRKIKGQGNKPKPVDVVLDIANELGTLLYKRAELDNHPSLRTRDEFVDAHQRIISILYPPPPEPVVNLEPKNKSLVSSK